MKTLHLGRSLPFDRSQELTSLSIPAHHFVTHAVVTGMTGSGKTGLVTVIVEEALRTQTPVLVIDVKGDLANLLLAPPLATPEAFLPWLDADDPRNGSLSAAEVAAGIAERRDRGLTRAGIDDGAVTRFRDEAAVRVLTPGGTGGESVHVLSSLERRSPLWDTDLASARECLASAVSLLLRLLDRDADPARSREHVLLSLLAERRLRNGQPADLASLIADLDAPPMQRVGAMAMDKFLSKKARSHLAASLNALLASSSFATWREGASLDVRAWLTPTTEGRTPAVIFSVAHLDDAERSLVLGLLLDEVLTYVRSLSGTSALRALIVFDEVYGFLPPHPANPPTKRPIVTLMKQARAFGVGVVIATQNPMDLDYRALSNAGLWFVGRLQTDADRQRVIDGLSGSDGGALGEEREALSSTVKNLGSRWFVLRNVHASEGLQLAQPRETISWMRGPMTPAELRRARGLT